MMKDSSDELQHPRRNLGQRFRSQSERFIKLASKDVERSSENLAWAEQNARQAILHDFTDYRNWIVLAKTKKMLGDSAGLKLVLEDVFTVLGRDPENLEQLVNIDYLDMGEELLAATLLRDPLDPDMWWTRINDGDIEEELLSFRKRCKILDFRDYRANIVYGRRLERIIGDGRDELFIELVQYLLAHRPTNHELWNELGKLHEKRNENEDAWLCYDNVQQLKPSKTLRDDFLARLTNKFEKTGGWSEPTVDVRVEFNKRMGELANKLSGNVGLEEKTVPVESESIDYEKNELDLMFEREEYQSAFFLARRLLSQGDEWAVEYFNKAKEILQQDVNQDE